MTTQDPQRPGPLLPDRHPQGDFFICDIPAFNPKGDLGTLEHPIFSLSTRPDRRILSYRHNDVQVDIIPSVRGRATMHDKDILIYCISQLMAALNAGRPTFRTLQLTAHDLLTATNRDTSGDGYVRLRDAFERLAGTRITTNLVTGGVETTRGFGLIESWEILRSAANGRMLSVSVTLSEWLFRAVLSQSVLTLSRDYFRLRKPLERRVYELARKHCGHQPGWRIGMATLHKKCGSAAPLRVFRAAIRRMAVSDHLPDYTMQEEPEDVMVFAPRHRPDAMDAPRLGAETIEAARALAPGADIYVLEAEWRGFWVRTGRPRLNAPDKAFLAWLARRIER